MLRSIQYESTGTMVSATSSEAASAIEVVIAKGLNSSPAMSPTKATGRNTMIVVTVEAVMAPATSLTAFEMARMRSRSNDRCLLMFSTTTIESSTTRPMAMVRAPSVSTLRV